MATLPSFKAYQQFCTLTEGVDDPGALKCVFMAGGPGSGKSYAVSVLFGINPSFVTSFSSYGLKIVSSDIQFEQALRQHGVDPKALAALHADPAQWAQVMQWRDAAKVRTQAIKHQYERGRLGLILDGTGDDAAKLIAKYRHATAMGYDCFMVFVNTSLETALARNAARPRSLPAEIVEASWRDVQRNLGTFQKLFGPSNLLIVDNDDGSNAVHKAQGVVSRWMNQPVKNPIGRQWMALMGGQYHPPTGR